MARETRLYSAAVPDSEGCRSSTDAAKYKEEVHTIVHPEAAIVTSCSDKGFNGTKSQTASNPEEHPQHKGNVESLETEPKVQNTIVSVLCEGDAAPKLDPLSELSEYRRLHQERYEQRITIDQKLEAEQLRARREQADEELARKLQEAEQRYMETRLASDAEYSRQLHEQINSNGAEGPSAFVTANESAEDNVRSPMRTGYSERLIDDSPIFSRRNPSSRRLLEDETPSREATWNPIIWLRDRLTDEHDRRTGWYIGPFLCTNRILAVYILVLTSVFALLVLIALQ